MAPTFWTNTIWYILLGILTSIQILLVIVKSDKKRLMFAYYLTILGLTFTFETIILIYFNAYEYYPLILKNPPYQFDDVLAGNVFSQTAVSASALVFVSFHLKNYWLAVFGIVYGCIEEWFIALNIYEHHWYRTWMTLLLIPIFIWIAKRMFINLQKGIRPGTYYIYIYLGLFLPYIIILLWGIFILFRIHTFNTDWLSNPMWSRTSIVLLNYTLFSIPIMAMIIKKMKWILQAIIIFFLYILYYFGYLLDVFIIRDGWFFVVATIAIFWLYLSTYFLNRWYGGIETVTKLKN